MGRTPQRFPGKNVEEDSLYFQDRGSATGEVGSVYRNGNDLFGHDSAGEFNLRSGGGISEGQHEDLDTLVHDLSETMYQEITRSGGQVTDVVWWTTSGKTTKVREVNITRTAGKVSQVVKKQYDGAGTLVQTLTGVITRSSGKVASIDWTET